MLVSAWEKGVVRERRDVIDSPRCKGVGGETRDVTDSARGIGLVWRDVIFQTVQGGKGPFGRE